MHLHWLGIHMSLLNAEVLSMRILLSFCFANLNALFTYCCLKNVDFNYTRTEGYVFFPSYDYVFSLSWRNRETKIQERRVFKDLILPCSLLPSNYVLADNYSFQYRSLDMDKTRWLIWEAASGRKREGDFARCLNISLHVTITFRLTCVVSNFVCWERTEHVGFRKTFVG